MRQGPGRVLEVLASSSIPLRPSSLALLISEREKTEALAVYKGDLLWSILGSLHAMCKSKLTAPSYSDMVSRMRGLHEDKKTLTNAEVLERVDDMISQFLRKEG